MNRLSLFAATIALALPAQPVAAQSFATGSTSRASQGPVFASHSNRHGFHGDRRPFRRGSVETVSSWGFYNLDSSYDDRDWAPESGNGWWHDRPDRAYPRWVMDQRRSGTCSEDRMWWSGTGWHC